jgi:hypothetical protein
MARKDGRCVRLDLAERDSLEPARALKPEIEATDASEQRQDFERRAAHATLALRRSRVHCRHCLLPAGEK